MKFKSRCKTCGHFSCVVGACIAFTVYEDNKMLESRRQCKCNPDFYIPTNNLEYLEWCLDKKGA